MKIFKEVVYLILFLLFAIFNQIYNNIGLLIMGIVAIALVAYLICESYKPREEFLFYLVETKLISIETFDEGLEENCNMKIILQGIENKKLYDFNILRISKPALGTTFFVKVDKNNDDHYELYKTSSIDIDTRPIGRGVGMFIIIMILYLLYYHIKNNF